MKLNLNKLFVNILAAYLWSLFFLPKIVFPEFVPDLHGFVGITLFAAIFWINVYLMRSKRLRFFYRIVLFVLSAQAIDTLWYMGTVDINFIWLVVYLVVLHLVMTIVPFEIRMIRNKNSIAIRGRNKGSVTPWVKALSDAGYEVRFVAPEDKFHEKVLLLETKDMDWNGIPDKVLCLSGSQGENMIAPEDVVEVVDEILEIGQAENKVK